MSAKLEKLKENLIANLRQASRYADNRQDSALFILGADEIERLQNIIEEMPEADITFHNKTEFNAWNAWKDKYFTTEGQLR